MNLTGIKELTIGGVKLKELTIGGVKVWQSGRLPAGYTEVEYIRLDGNSWFDTKINPADYPTGIEYFFKGRRLAQNNTNDYLWGCLADGKRSGNVSINSGLSNTVLYLSNSGTSLKKAPVPELNTVFEIYVKATPKDAANAVFKYNGASFANEFTPANSDMPSGSIYLGYCPNVGSTSRPFIGDVFPFMMTDPTNGSPILDYVTCIRNSDNSAGMFDLTTGRFDKPSGTGTAVAGPKV